MKLSEHVEQLKSDAQSVATASLLTAIEKDVIEELEIAAAADSNAESLCREMLKTVKGLRIDDIAQQQELYTKYGEARFYLTLRSKLGVQLVPRQTGKKTPDFLLNTKGFTFYGEVKSFLMAGGAVKYGKVLNDGLNSRIDAEEDIRGGKQIGIGEQVIQPHIKREPGYDPRSIRIVIDNLIDKYCQNYKNDQYCLGDTVSMIYLNAHNFPLVSYRLEDAIQPVWFDADMHVPVTGELWSCCLAHINDIVYRVPEFEGKANIEGRMTKQGILCRHAPVLAVLFLVDHLDRTSQLGCLYRHKDVDTVMPFVESTGAIYNNDENSTAWKLK